MLFDSPPEQQRYVWVAAIRVATDKRFHDSESGVCRETLASGRKLRAHHHVGFRFSQRLQPSRDVRRNFAFVAEEPHGPLAHGGAPMRERFLSKAFVEPAADVKRPERFERDPVVLRLEDRGAERQDDFWVPTVSQKAQGFSD